MPDLTYSIDQILPHAAPMILLDDVEASGDEWFETSVRIEHGSPFALSQGVPAHVALEYMAQTCAAFVGFEAMRAGQAPRIGLLLGTRNFKAERQWFLPGERLLVRVEVVYRDDQMGVFDGRVDISGIVAAEARLNVFQPPEGTTIEAFGE